MTAALNRAATGLKAKASAMTGCGGAERQPASGPVQAVFGYAEVGPGGPS